MENPQPSQPAANRAAQGDVPHEVGLVQQPHERILQQVFAIATDHLRPLRLTRSGKEPEDMAPPGAVARRMRVAGDVGVLMMFAMHADPGDGRPFAGQRAEQPQDAPHQRIRLEAEVGQQPMVSQAHAQPARQPRQHEKQQQPLPGEHQRRRQGADVHAVRSKGRWTIPGRATSARPRRGTGPFFGQTPLPRPTSRSTENMDLSPSAATAFSIETFIARVPTKDARDLDECYGILIAPRLARHPSVVYGKLTRGFLPWRGRRPGR